MELETPAPGGVPQHPRRSPGCDPPRNLRRIAGGRRRPLTGSRPPWCASSRDKHARTSRPSAAWRSGAGAFHCVQHGTRSLCPGYHCYGHARRRPAHAVVRPDRVRTARAGKIHVNIIGYGTNSAGIVAEGALKPQSDSR